MKKKTDGRRTIYFELAVLLVVAGVIAGVFFVSTYAITNTLLDRYVEKTDFSRSHGERYVEELREYLSENAIDETELSELDAWVRKTPVSVLLIFDESRVIYDNVSSSDKRIMPRDVYGEFISSGEFYEMKLGERDVRVVIYGNYAYYLYNTALIVCAAVSCVLLVIIVLAGIRGKIQYIRTLQSEIEVLEGGSLDCPVTVEGRDELASLAEGLDSLRRSFREQITESEQLSAANRTMVTEISHDLRTPLTSVLLYAEILQNGENLTGEKRDELIGKIVRKITHMKDLSDHLLEYSRTAGVTEAETAQVPVRTALYDGVSDLCGYLAEQGFDVKTDVSWSDVSVVTGDEYVARILDNISSNVMKYADPEYPVTVTGGAGETFFSLTFENRSKPTRVGGSGIGIGSIRTLMSRMGGSCTVSDSAGEFSVKLDFVIK